jgi:arylsulfatase A-like enzyme
MNKSIAAPYFAAALAFLVEPCFGATLTFQEGNFQVSGVTTGVGTGYTMVNGSVTDNSPSTSISAQTLSQIGNQNRTTNANAGTDGQQWNALFSFDLTELANYLTANPGQIVDGASFSLTKLGSSGTGSATSVNLYQTDPFTTGATWTTVNGSTAWTGPLPTNSGGSAGGGSKLLKLNSNGVLLPASAMTWTNTGTNFITAVQNALTRGDKTLYLAAITDGAFNGDSRASWANKLDATVSNRPLLTITTAPQLPPQFVSDPLNAAGIRASHVSSGYSDTISNLATDPNPGDALTFSKVAYLGGPASDWLTVAPNGTLTGTPSAAIGTYSWTVRVQDSSGNSDTATLNIRVVSANTPNILYILADDLGYADVKANTRETGFALEYDTPNIDRLCDAGVRFQAGLVSASVCAPSRAGLLTGRMGSRFGFEQNIPEDPASVAGVGPGIGLETGQKTIADILKTVGFKTFALGKWHLGEEDSKFHPNIRGFDEFYGMRGGSRAYTKLASYDFNQSIENNKVLVSEPDGFYITDFLTDQALAYITNQQTNRPGQPWFMYMSYTAPHGPMHAKHTDIDRVPQVTQFGADGSTSATAPSPLAYSILGTGTLVTSGTTTTVTSGTTTNYNFLRRIYGGMVVSLDDNVGRLLDKLDELGITNNTIVVFHSDNGGPGKTQNCSINNPLRDFKASLFEGGVRVPFAIKWPGMFTSNLVKGHNCPVSSLDLLPTFAAATGADQVQEIRTDGINLMPYLTLTGTAAQAWTTSPRKLFWRNTNMQRIAMRSGDYKYIKLRNATPPTEYLFDLGSSADERNIVNLATSPTHSGTTLVQMQNEFAAFEETIPDSYWETAQTGPNNYVTTYNLAITTLDLNPAAVGSSYSMALTYSNSSASSPVIWSLVGTGNPGWLSINPSTGALSGTPTKADPYYNLVRLQVSDGSSTSAYSVPLLIPDTNNISLDDWKYVHGIEGVPNNGDTDGDGEVDILEYAFGGDPGASDHVEMPAISVDRVNNVVTFKHLRRKLSGLASNGSAATFTYASKVSDDFSGWSPASITNTVTVDLGDGFEEVTLTLNLNLAVTSKKFVRLELSNP